MASWLSGAASAAITPLRELQKKLGAEPETEVVACEEADTGPGPAPPAPAPQREGDKFTGTQYRDVPWVFLFVLDLVAVAVAAGVSYDDGVDELRDAGDADAGLSSADLSLMVGIWVGCAAISVGLGFVTVFLARRYAEPMIEWSIKIMIGFLLVTGAAMCAINLVLGIVQLLFALAFVATYRSIREHIPGSAAVAEAACEILFRFPAAVFVALAFALLQVLVLLAIVFAAVVTQLANQEADTTTFFAFSWFWATQVLANIVHVTIAGVIATVFFRGDDMPRNPTAGALHRAVTTSLGSICFASLLVAAVQAIQVSIEKLRSEDDSIFLCFLACIFKCLEGFLRFFNKYALVSVAIYGSTFCQAAKDTWSLFRLRGLDTLVADSVVGTMLFVVSIGTTLIMAGLATALTLLSDRVHDNTAAFTITVVAAALIAFTCIATVMATIDSSVAAMIVSFAEDPAVLRRTKPDIYVQLVEKYNLW